MATHPCPVCAGPTEHTDRYPGSVCDDCAARAVDATGRPVLGVNVAMSGGFEARFRAPDPEAGAVCAEVTRTGAVWIDGRACTMGEARFGGVVVQALPGA